MSTPKQIIYAIGRKRVSAFLNVGETAISNAITRGKFPPAWFEGCRELASEVGIECPAHLFGQRGFSTPTQKRSDTPSKVQDPTKGAA
jgi:hypothetical protein